MSTLRGIWRLISILAVLHLLVLAGMVGGLWINGTLTVERVERIAAVLRGEDDAPAQDAARTAQASGQEGANAETTVAREQVEEEVARGQLEREKAELDQRLELVLREMNRVQQERELFEQRRQREAEAAKKKSEQNYRSGFQKQLEYFAKIKPKDALEYLLSREVEEAAELLRAMDTRQGKKIIEAAKTPSQRKKVDEILKLLPELKLEGEVSPES